MATVNGGSSNDTINTGNADDSITGGAGNDSIDPGAGNDTVHGGDGNDRIYADDGNDSVTGGDGDDSIDGEAGNDTLVGNEGNDTLDGGAGNDTISGDGGHDDIYGGSGDDSISGGDGEDWIWGEADNDTISGGEGSDSVFGGDGDDSIDGGSGDDTLHGEAGSDNIQGGDGGDNIYGGGGTDTIQGGTGQDWIRGGDGDDSIHGGADNDTVIGDDGDDTIHGDGGDDTLSGHEGDDAMHGGEGNDSLYGGIGDDYYDGGAGDDQFYMDPDAGGGRDFEAGDTDTDVVRLHSGSGHDVAYDFHGQEDYVYIGAIPEANIVLTQTGSTTWVLTISGGSSSDTLTLNFAPGTGPASEGELRDRLLTDYEYTPPENGNPGVFTPACFTAKSRILTPHGLRPIGKLRPGDLIVTADRGPQPILEILKTRFEPADLAQFKALRPIVIEADAFGAGLPKSKMHVSRQHAFAIKDGTALVRAVHLAEHFGLARIQDNRPNALEYLHLLLKDHHLLQVEGVWTESFYSAPNGAMTDILANNSDVLHTARCRPLLTRAYLRETSPDATDIGRLTAQSTPRMRGDMATASAPLWVSP